MCCPIGLSIPKYIFCYFKWDCFLIFLPNNSLFAEMSLIFVCYFMFYNFTEFVYSNSFLCNLVYKNPKAISSANRNDFNIFLILILFCLIALVRTFSTMLNRSGDNGHPCFVPDHRRNIFIFYYVNCGLFIYDMLCWSKFLL